MELTKKQKEMLNKHKTHHTKKHIEVMTKLMKQGKSFSQAHKMAMTSVGK
jgi:hypothetical protein